jgi:hypothetical protein
MAGYGVSVFADWTPSLTPPTGVTASVDFRGENISGTLTFRASPGVLSGTQRLGEFFQEDPRLLRDWACELTNQLLGRIKNKLRPYQLSFDVKVPNVLDGSSVPKSSDALRRRFWSSHGTFSSCLEVLLKPGFSLDEKAPEPPLPHEGELTLL